jgi:serine/threonine protein kinase
MWEVEAKRVVQNTNFCKVFDIFANNTKVYIFVDECQSLSLETRLKSGDTISEDEAKRWVRQVAEAISFLHSIGVSHNNLRPENVIFDTKNGIKVMALDMTSIYTTSNNTKVYIFLDEIQSFSVETRLMSRDPLSEDKAKRLVKKVAEAIS